MEPKQPLINKKLVIRTLLSLFTLALLLAVYSWLRNRGTDVDLGSVQSKDWIAALEYTRGSGTHAVIIKTDGTILPSPGFKDGTHDRDLAWRPDGNRLYFSSDREENAFNIYRWNLASGLTERRTLGKITKSDPSFQAGEASELAVNPIIVFSGMAWELDPGDGKANQLVPPKTGKNDAAVDTRDESSGDKLSGGFGEGAAFKVMEARYFGGKQYVAVIRRTDTGECLSIQSMEVAKNHRTVAAGDRIFMDVDPHSGKLYYSVLGFQWPDQNNIPPQFITNGVIKKPFAHYILGFNAATFEMDMGPVIASTDDSSCFSHIAISPDGTTLACVVGEYKSDGEFSTKAIISMPAAPSGARNVAKLYPGGKDLSNLQITNLSWSPDGKHITFGTIDSAHARTVCVIDKDGSNYKELTKGKGDFGLPVFSPQN